MKIFLLPLVLLLSINSFAQDLWGPKTMEKNVQAYYLELLGGAIFPSMVYKGNQFEGFKTNFFVGQVEGIAIRNQFNNLVSISGLVSFRSQGVSVQEIDNYIVKTNYLNFYMPFEFDFSLCPVRKGGCPSVFTFIGPYAAYNLGGNIETTIEKKKITSNEFNKFDFGAELGFGFRIPTFSSDGRSNLNLKASYYHGFTDTYPQNFEGYGLEQMENLLLSELGSRVNHGFKLTLSYEISLERKALSTFTAGGNGKTTYKRFVNVK